MEVNLSSKNHKIIVSGTVCSFEDDPVIISFGTGANKLEITLSFEDTDSKELEQKTIVHSKKKLELKLLNFNNSLGNGNISPLYIGNLEDKDLFLTYRIYKLDNSKIRHIHYTIYQEK